MYKTSVELPNKLSALIRAGLADLEKIERNKAYVVDMATYHTSYNCDNDGRPYADGRRCHVCFAGAVMVGTLGVELGDSATPRDFPGLEDKLNALDEVRVGNIGYALLNFNHHLSDDEFRKIREAMPSDIQWLSDDASSAELLTTHYDSNPAAFKRDMENIAKALEAAGL